MKWVKFTELQCRILAVLEEAGEDNAATLINMVGKGRGDPTEIDAVGEALTQLMKLGLIETAKVRDPDSHRWRPLPPEQSLASFLNLIACVQWSTCEGQWKWQMEMTEVEVLLTAAGTARAKDIISKYGCQLAEPPRKRGRDKGCNKGGNSV